MKLFALNDYEMVMDYPDTYIPDSECNGCGSGWNEALVPDSIYGLDISPACCVHDFMYAVASTTREQADDIFLSNLLDIIEAFDKWWYPTWLARHRAVTYYDAVRRSGGKYFGKDKQ